MPYSTDFGFQSLKESPALRRAVVLVVLGVTDHERTQWIADAQLFVQNELSDLVPVINVDYVKRKIVVEFRARGKK